MVRTGGPVLIRDWMEQVVQLRRSNIEVIWVSSGAISSAVNRTSFSKTRTDWQIFEKQALSAIGQPILMDLYNLALHATGIMGAQVLLTASDLAHKDRRRNFQQTLEQILKWQVVPILNENDAIATEEIKFGDNDSLSAQVAGVMKADRLIILTDVDGLFEQDPRFHPDAKLISHVKKITPKILRLAGAKSGTSHGVGGMFSKIHAARMAGKAGVGTTLVRGDIPSVLLKIAQNNFIGTVFEVSRS